MLEKKLIIFGLICTGSLGLTSLFFLLQRGTDTQEAPVQQQATAPAVQLTEAKEVDYQAPHKAPEPLAAGVDEKSVAPTYHTTETAPTSEGAGSGNP